MAALAATGISSRLRNCEHSHRFRRVRDAQRDRLGSRLEAEPALDRRHFIRLVPKDPFGHRQRVLDPAVTTADLQVLSNRAGFRGVVKGDLVVSRPVDLYLPGNLSAARPTEAVPGLLLDAIVPRGRSASVQGCGGVAFDRNRGILDDEIHDRLRVFRRKRKMPFALPDDNRDLSAELLITFLDDASLACPTRDPRRRSRAGPARLLSPTPQGCQSVAVCPP